MKIIDLRVYAITTSLPALGRTHGDVAAAAMDGGATVIQFRDKTMLDHDFAETAARIGAMARARGVPFIINDRVELALAVGADGVHVGRNDADLSRVRAALPPGMILGISATDHREALAMRQFRADYLGVGPVFATGSKDDCTPAIGLEELARICRDVSTPVVAIGGINRYNLRAVIDTGVAGAAVIAAIAAAPDMAAAAAEFKSIWQTAAVGRASM